MRWTAVMLLLFIFIGMVPVTAGELPDCKHVYINVANDNGPRFSDHENGSYYLKFDGGGLNALHLTTDAAYPSGQVTTSPDQSGVFYITDTGGRGYSDNTILMLAVNGTIPDDFVMKVRASGYNWEPVTVKNTLPALEDLKHIDGTMEETFTKEDFIYGPQTWKPAGNNLPMAYPIYFGQDTSDTGNPFHLMFIDLKAGPVSKATGLVDRNDLTDGGAVKVEYSFENLETFAAFNAYVWCNQSNQGQGISWTNRVSGTESSVYQVVGIPPELTTISVSPATAEVDVGESLQFAATALDQRDRSMDGVTFEWTSSDETVGTVDTTGSFTALAAGTTTLTAANGTVRGTAEVTVTAAPSGPQPLPDYNHIFFKVANDAGVKYDAFGNQTYNVRFEGINRGLNALHISTDPAVNFGQVTVTENQSGTFYATDSGGKGYEDEIILLVAVNGSIPQDLRLHVKADGYTWTPNPVCNQPPPLDTVTYQSSALEEVFTTEDFIYGPQIWKPTGNECDYPLYAGQDMEDKENTFHLMFIDLNAGVLRPNADLENRGAVRINYTFENLDTFAAFSVYGYCKNSNNGDDMVAWSNALLPDKAMSGYSVIGTGAGPEPAGIEVTPATASLTVGEERQFAATAFDTDGSDITGLTFTWSSSNETVGTVDTTGSFTALAAGTTTLSAAYGGVAGQAEVTVGTAAPQTWYVGDDAGSDYSTIQSAVDAAKAGDTIVVKNGTYNENVDVTRSLTIRSEHGAAHTTLTSANKDSGFDITADNVILEGFTITGVNGKGNFGIYVHGAEGAVIAGNTVENCRECLKIESSSGNTVQNNVLSVSNNAANNVFWLADASDNLIYLNDFKLGAVTVEGTSEGNVFQSQTEMQYALNGDEYESYMGNHWSGYAGSDPDGDGIGNDAHPIAGSATDNYPLVQALETYTIYDPVPESATYYVGDGEGSDYSTIQAAVDAAKAGDTIVVRDGTYNENVDVTRSLTIRSEHGAAHTTLTSANRDSGFDITADDVTLEGFTITGVNGRGNFGIYVHGADGAVISGNTVENCRESLKIESSSGDTVQNNVLTVSNAANNVFWLADASNNLIYLNDFNLGAVTVEGTSSGNIWTSPLKIRYSLDGTVHIGTLGNHWNGYTGADTNSDGIGEDPYTITDDNTDASPLVRPQADYVTDDLPEGIVITIDPLNPWIKSGETLGFTASAVDAEGKPIEDAAFVWSSSNTTVGTIGTDGVFTAGTPGVTTISASCGGATASTDLTVVRTRYVDASGGADFTTIQAAVDAACNGDTIVVRDGTYSESVAVTKPLVIRSENGPEKTVVQGVTSDGAVFNVEADDTTISGLTLTGTGSAGIFCGDHSGCTFSEIVCSGDSGPKKGIWALRGSGIEVENNTLSQLFTGVLFADCSNSIIRNNTCSDNQNGIEFSKTSGQKEQNNTVSGNLITGNSYGVGLSSVSGCHVTRNTLRENDCALQISFASENNEIYANTIVNNTGLFWVDLNAPNLWNSPEAVTYLYNGATYTGLVGNYWGGAFPVQDADKNGIADSAVTLFAGNVDNAPLMMPVPAYSGGSCDGIPVPTSIEITQSSDTVPEEGEQEFTATVYDQNGKEMTGIGFEWTSSNETVGTFAQGATFTALFPGETTVLVQSHGLEATAEVTVEQTSVRTVWTDFCESTDGWTLNNAGLIDSVVYTGSHSIGVEPCPADSSAERTIDFSEGCTELSFRMYNDRMSGGAGIQSTIKVFLDGEMMKEIKSQFTRSQWYTYSFDISGYEPGPHTLKVESHFVGKSNQGAGYYIDLIKLRTEMPEESAITLSPATADLKVGEVQQFTATAYNETGEELTGISFVWSSSNPDVGSVDANGYFTALSKGTTTITAAYGGMSGESTVSVTVPHGEQRKKASLDVPGCEIATGDDGQQKIRINASESGASVEGDLIQIKKETCTLNVRTRGVPSVENGTVNGDVSGIVLETNPITTTLDAVGTVSASLVANLTGLPTGAALETTVSRNVSADARNAFQLAATADGLNLGAIAYTMNIEKTNLTNGEDIANATITMAVSPAWVDAHGGVDAVRIIRSAEDGTKEVLKTVLVGTDTDGNMVFEAISPKGLSIFGLTAVTKAAEPPASSSSSSGGSGSSDVAAISGSIPAGESQTFAVSKTAITTVTIEAYDQIDDLLVTVQKASLSKEIPAPEGPTYQLIEADLYHTDASAIDAVTLEFAVPSTWLKEHGLSTDKIVLLQYENDGWKPLKTTFVEEENGEALYSAKASGFSYFAIASGETTSAAGQAGETETPAAVVTDAPAPAVEETTAPATTAPTQKSPVPWFLSIAAIGALFLLKRD